MRQQRNQKKIGHKGRRDKDNKKTFIIVLAVAVISCIGYFIYEHFCPDRHLLPYEGVVRDVNSNGSLVMDNGLTVELLGVSPSQKSNNFLDENVKGKRVKVIADSHDSKPYYVDASKDVVRGYVTIEGYNVNYTKLNGYLIRKGYTTLNSGYCQDSLATWNTNILEDPKPGPNPTKLYTKEELFTKMAPATFLITTENGNGSALGTGFFINEDGLALTNYHVLAGSEKTSVYLCDEKGNITPDRDRPIGRIVVASKKYDWCIFVVRLDNGEKSPYLDLAREQPVRGVDVGVVGNPRGLLATYTTGAVTNIHDDAGQIQIDASMTQGNSGGPICNFYGEVVGIAQSVLGNGDGTNATGNINFGTDIMLVREVLDNLKDVKYYGGK